MSSSPNSYCFALCCNQKRNVDRNSREQILTSLFPTLDCNDEICTTWWFWEFVFRLGQYNHPYQPTGKDISKLAKPVKKACAKPVKLIVASCLEGKILDANFGSIAGGVSNFYTIITKTVLPHSDQAIYTSSQGNCSLLMLGIKR